MRLTVLTPTCDRPMGLALLERWMARQTRLPDEWIVADGGKVPAELHAGQIHVRPPYAPAGPLNFLQNLDAGLAAATGDVIAICEDDDWYRETHLATLLGQLEAAPRALVAGDDHQRYYHVGLRRWRIFENKGASLCQTALRREALPTLQAVIAERRQARHYGVDGAFWAAIPRSAWALARTHTVLGIKGLPGQTGLGIGHKPAIVNGWTHDPSGAYLRRCIGDDADLYLRKATA